MRKPIRNCYIKDYGDHASFMSGRAIPCNEAGITDSLDFVDCDFHPASVGDFRNCAINGQPIPDGVGNLYNYAHRGPV